MPSKTCAELLVHVVYHYIRSNFVFYIYNGFSTNCFACIGEKSFQCQPYIGSNFVQMIPSVILLKMYHSNIY